MAFGFIDDALGDVTDFVGDVAEGATDITRDLVEKPLTSLFGGIGEATEDFGSKLFKDVGHQFGRLMPKQRSEEVVDVSLVEDAQLPEARDPRGQRGARSVTTQTANILTPQAEQPTLLG